MAEGKKGFIMTYQEKLKHPKWQKKRLEILERDKWTCRHCLSTDKTLHVHHINYADAPWETDNKFLITLCHDCHSAEEINFKQESEDLIKSLKKAGFMSFGLYLLSKMFEDTYRDWATYEPNLSVLKGIIDDDELFKQASDIFWIRLKKELKKHG